MNWISGKPRATLKKTNIRTDVPDDFWDRCPDCGAMLFHEEIEKSHHVCPRCGYHFRLPVTERLKMLFDGGKYTLIPVPSVKEDPIHFTDLKKYTDRLKEARKKTAQNEAVIMAKGLIGKKKTILVLFNFDFMGGSMGIAVGETIITAVNLAIKENSGLVVIPASGGARMQEGMLSLVQMARTTLAIQKLKEKKLPYIVVLTNPTTGGVTASFAMLGDIMLAEPGAIIGFAGARVIEQTIHQKLPPKFQTAEYLFDHGMIDAIIPRDKLHDKLGQILNLLMV